MKFLITLLVMVFFVTSVSVSYEGAQADPKGRGYNHYEGSYTLYPDPFREP